MFLYFRSLSEVRNQMRENRQEMFVFADGTLLGLTREIFIHSFIKHLLNAHYVPDSLTGWCRDESQSLPSRVPMSSGEMGQKPNKDNIAMVPSMLCEDRWREGAPLRQRGDGFLRDIFSNPSDTLLQVFNYAFILTYITIMCIKPRLHGQHMWSSGETGRSVPEHWRVQCIRPGLNPTLKKKVCWTEMDGHICIWHGGPSTQWGLGDEARP